MTGPPSPAWRNLHQGRHTYGNFRIVHFPGDPPVEIRIGNFTSIANGVQFMPGGNHHPEWASTYPFRIRFQLPGALADGQPASRGPIIVGNDVWIGQDALILSGVSIGDGAVVGAGAVVARDVRPYAVVVGNPAHEVRRRFTDIQVEELLRLRWWDWPDGELTHIARLLNGADVTELIAYGTQRTQT